MERTLNEILGHDEQTGAYPRAHMLRRIAQQAIAFDRGISNQEIADRMGVTREYIRLYFQGRYEKGGQNGVTINDVVIRPNGAKRSRREVATRRQARLRMVRKCRDFEDAVERALEDISRDKDLSPPRVIGTPEETYIRRDVLVRDLMKAPSQTSRTKALI